MVFSSLLISTYNWPEALNLCLKSVFDQSTLPGEIIICDDGSTVETGLIIKKYQATSPTPIVHVWQKDDGFKLGQIRNKGIAKAKGDYIIQIDGDLILHKHFIKDHLNLCKKNFFTTGSRVLLSPETTVSLIENNSTDIKNYSKKNRNIFNGMHIPALHSFFSQFYKTRGKHKYYVKGCNMAFWKNDLLTINGYNEDFTGWGNEDSELAIRLINAGIKKQFLKFGGITYHLYHKEASRDMELTNFKMMQQTVEKKIMRTTRGVDQYL
jgi:glycosyltransferase involved in cell wall biosynthesis